MYIKVLRKYQNYLLLNLSFSKSVQNRIMTDRKDKNTRLEDGKIGQMGGLNKCKMLKKTVTIQTLLATLKEGLRS